MLLSFQTNQWSSLQVNCFCFRLYFISISIFIFSFSDQPFFFNYPDLVNLSSNNNGSQFPNQPITPLQSIFFHFLFISFCILFSFFISIFILFLFSISIFISIFYFYFYFFFFSPITFFLILQTLRIFHQTIMLASFQTNR